MHFYWIHNLPSSDQIPVQYIKFFEKQINVTKGNSVLIISTFALSLGMKTTCIVNYVGGKSW